MLKSLWDLVKKSIVIYKKLFIAGYLYVLVAAACAVAMPLTLQRMIDDAIYPKDLNKLYGYITILVVLVMVYTLAQSLKEYFLVKASEKTFYDVRKRLVSTVMRKPIQFFSKFEKGDLYTRLSNNMDLVSWNFFRNLINYTGDVVIILAVLVSMMVWQWRLGVSAAISFIICFYVVMKMSKIITKETLKSQQKLSLLNDVTLDLLNGYKEIQLFQQTKKADDLFEKAADDYTGFNIKSLAFTRWTIIINEGIGQFFMLLPYIVGGYWSCKGAIGITIGVIAAYYSWVAYITVLFLLALGGLTEIVRLGPVIDRIKEIKDYPEQENIRMQNIDETPTSACIEYKNISFGYGEKPNIFNDFNLTINPTDKMALVGPSGSGKSTLVDLLMKRQEPRKGEILFGGKPIQKYPVWFYLHHFAYVGQEPHLFKLSIRDNISMGWYDIPFDRIVEAAKLVRIHDDIEKLPNKYDTIIGMNGENLSVGQKQRLILARAIIREPEILVLDEFTSALDKANEDAILKDVIEAFKKQTIICITHSNNVASKFNNIITLEKS